MAATPPFSLRGLDHVVLRCRDVQRMAAFYTGVLGCTIAKHNQPLGLLHLRAGSTLIDLVAVDGELGRAGGGMPDPGSRNMDHLCLRIEPFDPAALAAWLAAHGVETGKLARRFGAEGDGLSLYLVDPEGNGVELKGRSS